VSSRSPIQGFLPHVIKLIRKSSVVEEKLCKHREVTRKTKKLLNNAAWEVVMCDELK
jgi:hypothetical protein